MFTIMRWENTFARADKQVTTKMIITNFINNKFFRDKIR